jgi:serine protease Do
MARQAVAEPAILAARDREVLRKARGEPPGVVVTQIDPDGPAAERGFRTGDVILDVGGKTVSTPADVRNALQQAHRQGKHTILMRVKSGDQTKFVALPVGNA